MRSTTPSSAPTLRLVPPPITSELAGLPLSFPVRDRSVKFVLTKIHENLAQTQRVKDLAQEAGVHPDYLERLFHAEMHQTITQYMGQRQRFAVMLCVT